MFMLFGLTPVVGSYSPDLPHKAYGDTGNAVASSGLGLLRCGLVFAVNFFSGPWKGSGFFRQAQGVWRRFSEQAVLEDPYFQFWASEPFLETGLPETQFGTDEGMRASLKALCRCHALQTRGERVKLSRWWSLIDRLEEFLPHWFSVACTVTLLGLERGTFADMGEVACASAGHLRSDADREVKYKPGDKEDEKEKQLRSWGEVHSSLRGVICILASSLNRSLAAMLVVVTRPVRKATGIFLKEQHKPTYTKEFLVKYARGAAERPLAEVAAVCGDLGSLKEIGFHVSAGVQTISVLNDDDEILLGKYTMRYMTALLGDRVLSDLRYRWTLPLHFFCLLDNYAPRRTEALGRLRSWWQRWLALEEKALHDSLCQAFCRDLVWPAEQWPRLLMMMLDEVDFQHVPDRVVRELEDVCGGLCSSKCVEDVIGELRRSEQLGGSGELGSSARWLRLYTSRALSAHGRKLPNIEEARKHTANLRVPQHLFNPEHAEYKEDLTDEFIKVVKNDPSAWRSPDSSSYDEIPLQWHAMMDDSVSWEGLSKLWCSSLAGSGMVIAQKGNAQSAGLVIYACSSGVILWNISVEKWHGKSYYLLRCSPSTTHSREVHILEARNWSGVLVEGITPAALRSALTSSSASSSSSSSQLGTCLRLRATTGQRDLVELSALQGFQNLTVPRLKQLWVMEGLPGGQELPKHEEGLVNGLLKHCLGEDCDMVSPWKCRGNCRHLDVSVGLSNAVQSMAEFLEDEDLATFQAVVDESESAKLRHRQRFPPSEVPGSSEGSGNRVVQHLRLPSPGVEGEWTVEEVSALMPKGGGIHIYRETVWHSRWRVLFREYGSPNSKSFSYGKRMQETDAVRNLVRWAWAVHAREGGDICPHKLD